jgi:hypothetical protein
MLRRSVRAVLVAVFVAVPFAVVAPHASADCMPVGPADVCTGSAGGINADIPGLLHVCIRLNSVCPNR